MPLARATLLCLLAIPSLTHAQGYTLKTETHLIDTTVSVHNPQGGLVPNLTRDDLQHRRRRRPPDHPLLRPTTPTSPSPSASSSTRAAARTSSSRATKRTSPPSSPKSSSPATKAFAVCFGNHLRLVSDFTANGPSIVANIASFDRGSRDFPELGPHEERELGTALNDAIYFATTLKLANKPRPPQGPARAF